MWQNLLDPLIQWNDLVHLMEKLLLLYYLFLSTVYHVAEGRQILALST